MAKEDHHDKQFQLLKNVSQPLEIFLSQNQCFMSIALKNNIKESGFALGIDLVY